MASRAYIAALLTAAALITSLPAALAAPDAPMCVAEQASATVVLGPQTEWRAPMCGPFIAPLPIRPKAPSPKRAVRAYVRATEAIKAADYEEARLQLDLAHAGLPEIRDRIALQIGRLELLRQRPARAAGFFEEASRSPHESVAVEARFHHVFALLRSDDPSADAALEALLASYPAIPRRSELLFELAQSLLRRGSYDDAAIAMHTLRIEHPATKNATWAADRLVRLRAAGYAVPTMTDEERVRRARLLVGSGPMDAAKAAVETLLERPLTGEQHAEVHYLAGRLARFEGRWRAAETYMRTAQLFPMPSPTVARTIESRASDMAEAANARDAEEALRTLSVLRAGRRPFQLPSTRIVEMIEVAAPAGLRDEVDALLVTLRARKGVSAGIVLDAAIAGLSAANEEHLIALLRDVAKRPYSRHRAAALYHLARLHERAGRSTDARLLFTETQTTADITGDDYYALWASLALRRLANEERTTGLEGLVESSAPDIPAPPRVSDDALARLLEPVAEVHRDTYPWLARAVDALRIGEREAATEELFETYLQWRDALGRPVARAGLDCVARADGRTTTPVASDVRAARQELSTSEREVLSAVASALGDVGTAGGFAGPGFIESLPRAYEWLVVPAAHRYGLDPNLLLAVMRVESAYQKHIVSYAGAVGLMQIMPRTGQLIAHALERDDFTPADLLDPRTNLEFAAWYLTSLIRRFDGHLPLAIAAYNGGPHNVRRWIQQNAQETPLDVLLERIPFTQTHRYVRKVLVHYEAYRKQRDLPMIPLSVELPEPRVDPVAF